MRDNINKHLKENENVVGGKLHITENFSVQPKITQKSIVTEGALVESKKDGKMVLRPRIEAIHAGRTRNGNIYLADRLKGDFKEKSGVYSFLYPYAKPMIKNHDHDSEPTGRIKNAQFVTDSATGRECILIIPEITDPETIEKILDGRYMTVSIGATTDSAICNICGTNIIEEGWCGHDRGEIYDGVECGWIAGNLWFDECSWVNVPADSDAMVIDQGEPTLMEAYAQVEDKFYNLSADDNNIELKESVATMLGLHSETNEADPEEEGGSTKVTDMTNQDPVVQDPATPVVENGVDPTVALEQTTEPAADPVTEPEVKLDEKDEQIATLTAQVQEKDNTINALTEEKATLETQLNEKTTELETAKESLQSVEAERDALTEEVANLKAAAHKALAERVVELKKVTGKMTEAEATEALEAHVARSPESLNDSLADLLTEAKNFNYNASARVLNPAMGAIGGEPGVTIEGKTTVSDPKNKEVLTKEQVYVNLFSGKITR